MSAEHGRYVYSQYGDQYAYPQHMQYDNGPQPTQPPPMRTVRSGSSSHSTNSSPQVNHYSQHPSSQPSYYPHATHPTSHGHHQQQQTPAPPQSSTSQWAPPTDAWQNYGQSYASQQPPVEPQAPQYAATSSRQPEPTPPAASPFDQRGSYQYAYSQAIPAQVHHLQVPQSTSYNDTQPRRAEDRQPNIPPPLSSSSSSSLSANLPPQVPPSSSNPPHPLASVTHHHNSYSHPSSLHAPPLSQPQPYQTPRHSNISSQAPSSTQVPAPSASSQHTRQQHHPDTQPAPQYYGAQYQTQQQVQAVPPPPPPVPTPTPLAAPIPHSPYTPYQPPEPAKSTDYSRPVDYGRSQEYQKPNDYEPSTLAPSYKAPKREKDSPATTPMPPPPHRLPPNPSGLDFLKLLESYKGVLEACDALSQSGGQAVFGSADKNPDDTLARMLQHATYGAQMLEAAVAALSPQPVQIHQQTSSYPLMATTRPPSVNSVRNHDMQSQSPMAAPPPPVANQPRAPQQHPPAAPTHVTITQAPAQEPGNGAQSTSAGTPVSSTQVQPKKKKEAALPGESTMQLTIHQHNPDGTTTNISGGPPEKDGDNTNTNSASQASRPPSNGGSGGSHKRQKQDADGDGQTCLGCGATSTPEWRRGPLGPRTLCNACGLVYAKLIKKRAKETNPGSSGSSSGRQKNHSNAIPGVPNVNGVTTSVMDLGSMHTQHRDGSGDGDSDYGGRS